MTVRTVTTRPVDGQKPGTSGLRAKTRTFMQPGYLENFVQLVFDTIGPLDGKSLVVGGDGRFFNKRAIQTIMKPGAGRWRTSWHSTGRQTAATTTRATTTKASTRGRPTR